MVALMVACSFIFMFIYACVVLCILAVAAPWIGAAISDHIAIRENRKRTEGL
ncbi:hypothetical protein LCGC14_0344770 [marine sediment metagenome]|uniref:Uncharacterized protein n=1 Tax=marine sediment metagenome TaxID=412755 RepID=A0A0F9W011_9ZZZZ